MNTREIIRELNFADKEIHSFSREELRTLIRLSRDALERVQKNRQQITRQRDEAMLSLLISHFPS